MKSSLKFFFILIGLFFHSLSAQVNDEILPDEVLLQITNAQITDQDENQSSINAVKQANETKKTAAKTLSAKKFLISLGGGVVFAGDGFTLFSVPVGFEWRIVSYFGLGAQFYFLPTLGEDFSYFIQLRASGNVAFAKSFEAYVAFGINYNGFETSEIRKNSWGWSILGGIRYDAFKNFGIYAEGGFPGFINAGGYYRF